MTRFQLSERSLSSSLLQIRMLLGSNNRIQDAKETETPGNRLLDLLRVLQDFFLTQLSTLYNFWVLLDFRVILSVLDPRKCEYLKDYSLDFEHAYMTTYPAS